MTMHYSILYVLLDTYYVLGIYVVVFLFIANEGILSRHDRHEEKKNYEIFYDSLTCKFSPGDNRPVLGDHTPRCQHQAFLLLTGGSGVITLCIL